MAFQPTTTCFSHKGFNGLYGIAPVYSKPPARDRFVVIEGEKLVLLELIDAKLDSQADRFVVVGGIQVNVIGSKKQEIRVITVSPDGKFIFCSTNGGYLVGYSVESLVGLDFDKDVPHMARRFDEILTSVVPLSHDEFTKKFTDLIPTKVIYIFFREGELSYLILTNIVLWSCNFLKLVCSLFLW